MSIHKNVVLGMQFKPRIKPFLKQKDFVFNYLSDKRNPTGQILLTLSKFLTQYTKTFERATIFPNFEPDGFLSNGVPVAGLSKHINQSKVDVGVIPMDMSEDKKKAIDFCYPFQLFSHTFLTAKPEYESQIFGILQTFSIGVWIAVAVVVITMMFIHYIFLKNKYSLRKTLFHVFATMLRQNCIITPSSVVENILIYLWIIGTMFICLAYESVILSFLAFPPVVKIKHLSDLAAAVESGKYHCITSIMGSGLAENYIKSNHKYLKVIGEDLFKSNLTSGAATMYFIQQARSKKLAFITDADSINDFPKNFFVSEDNFGGVLVAMEVRKDFCCKKVLDKFIHRMMASGIYSKYYSHANFIFMLPVLQNSGEDISERSLTLTDVAPPFMFLLLGYIASSLIFILEILSSRKNKLKFSAKIKRKKKEVYNQSSV